MGGRVNEFGTALTGARRRSHPSAIGIAFALGVSGLAAAAAQTAVASAEPNEQTRARLQNIVKGILVAWNKADVICLGEDHGSRNDSDLRIALVAHSDFVRSVNVVIVESANIEHQDILDRFVLDGEDMPRQKLRTVWSDATSADVWDSPIYEAFLRAVHKANLAVPRHQRVRLIGGDNPKETNRGRFIRGIVSREILSKRLKGLAIYGSGHCERRGGGFPGELESTYPGKIWAASTFYDVEEGRRVFGLGDEPKLIPVTGTESAKIPGGKMFYLGRSNDPATLGDLFDAILYFGSARDTKVYPDKR
jgi:uncharacterized iron-regulated protein